MIILINKVTDETTTGGKPYKKVTGINVETQKEVTKSVFDNLVEKWPMLEVNKTVDLKLEQKGNYWNVVDILLPQTPPAVNPGASTMRTFEIPPVTTDPTRKSIERQTSLKAAVEVAVAKIQAGADESPVTIINRAMLFESYIESGAQVVKE